MIAGTLEIQLLANMARLHTDMSNAQKSVGNAMSSIEKSVDMAKKALTGLVGGFSVVAVVGKLVSVQREFDVMNASLITMTGSSANAAREMAWIKQFAAQTPYGLNEVTQGFVKMKSLGLDPSQKALNSYGNTASAMGKGLNQMIEAVADAATGEFERLKEFGIKSSKEGDKVSLTFQGVTTSIGNNSAEITKYLQAIGDTQFGGAMAERAKTLDGAISNLTDTWDELLRTVNEKDAGSLIYDSVMLASGAIGDAITIMKAMSAASAENSRETGAMATIQNGLAVVFETVAVLGVNLKYILVQIGDSVGGLAAQVASAARLDFSGVKAIQNDLIARGAEARKQVDETSARILGARKAAQDLATWKATGPNMPDMIKSVTPVVSANAAAMKAAAAEAKKLAEEQRRLVESGSALAASLLAVESGLSGDFAKKWDSLGAAYKSNAISIDMLIASQAALLGQQPAMKAAAKALQDESAAYLDTQKELNEAYVADSKSREQGRQAVSDYAEGIAESAKAIQYEYSLMGLSAQARDIAMEQYRIELDLKKQIAAVDSNGGFDEAQREEARAQLRAAATTAMAAASDKVVLSDWKESVKQYDDIFRKGFADMVNGGQDAWKSFTKSLVTTFKTSVADQIYKMFAQPFVMKIVASLLGVTGGAVAGMASAATGSDGGVGYLGMASNASSLYSAGSTFAVGSQVLGGTMGIANGIGTIAANATGTGISGLLATNGAYGTAAAGSGSAIAGGATSALAAIPVWGWVALAAIAVAGMFGGRGDKEATGGGIEGSFGGAGFSGNSFSTWQQDGGWFHNDRTGKETGNLDSATTKQFTDAYGAVQTSAAMAAAALGLSADAIINYSQSISIQLGSDAAANEQAVTALFSGIGDGMARAVAPGIAQLAKEGESAGGTLARLAGSLVTVNSTFDVLGLTLMATSLDGANMASNLLDAFGGIEKFAAVTGAYYDNFYTEEEKRLNTLNNISRGLSAGGVVMSAEQVGSMDRSQFRKRFEDYANEYGADSPMAMAMINVNAAFASVTPAVEGAVAGISEALRKLQSDTASLQIELMRAQGNAAGANAAQYTIDTSGLTDAERAVFDYNAALRDQITTINTAAEAQVAAQQKAKELIAAALEGVRRAIAAEKERIGVIRDVAQQSVASITGVFGLLREQVSQLYGTVGSTQAMQASQGNAFIDQALSTVRATGYLPDQQQLASAIAAARGGLDASQFATQYEADKAALVMAGKLSQLQAASGYQLTAAEQALKVANDQLSALDSQLEYAQQQVDALNGINTSVLSVTAAIASLASAMAAQAAAKAAANPAMAAYSVNDTPADRQAKVEAQTGVKVLSSDSAIVAAAKVLYQSAGHGGASTAEYNAAATAVGGDIASAVGWDGSQAGIEALRAKYSFAVGTNYVPYDMTAQLHEGEAIVPKAYNPAAGGRGIGNTDRLERLVESLTAEVKLLKATVAEGTQQQTRTADAVNGRPDRPMLVEVAT